MIIKKLNETVKEMYKEGLCDEQYVMSAIEETLGGKCEKSKREEDMFDHIDVWWESPKKGRLGIEVKGLKKNKRTDKDYDDTIHWIEFMNVKGNPGWLYGKSDYIAFRTKSNIIFVRTETLRTYAESKIKGKELVFKTPKDFYIPYQRKWFGRLDMTIKVPTSDLYNISEFIIENI